jgi:hypothetical protein
MSTAINRLLTPTRLREVVRANLRMGVTKDAISLLILNYIPPEARTDRVERGISRQALEDVPPDRRGELLRDLQQMAELQERVSAR